MIPAIWGLVAIGSSQSEHLLDWGRETLSAIERDFAIPGSPLFADRVGPDGHKSGAAFNWGAGVLLSAFNAAAVEPSYDEDLRRFADGTRSYWNAAGPVPGYDVVPNAGSADRYFDDNAWMALALAETYDRLGDRKYLDWAKDALRFSLSGEDSKLGGGIYWRESDKKTKNTCSNAPVAAGCLAIYERDRDPRLLDKAEDLYDWTKRTLQNPEDHLMWDNVDVATGRIEKTEWSYNTALMIRTAVDLYRITREPRYLHDEREMRTASVHRWLGPNHELKDSGRFAHLLLESWIRAESIDPTTRSARMAAFVDPLVYVHAVCRKDGLYGNRWDGPPATDQRQFELIDQASAARGFFEVGGIGR
jgi:uncharacterized protein YyaL (SSP411 family)